MDRTGILAVRQALAGAEAVLAGKQAVIGFDGYIDELTEVVRQRQSETEYEPFASMRDFGRYIAEAGGSCGLEVVSRRKKIGGNGPIMAAALGQAGVDTQCIGLFGLPEIHPIFREMPKACRLHSVGNPAYTQAFEFADGKIMLGNQANINGMSWDTLEKALGREGIAECLGAGCLLGITNWSELIRSNDLWEGLLEHCMPRLDRKQERHIFFDLADPEKRSKEDLRTALGHIRNFTRYGRVVLGLNRPEALLVRNLLVTRPSDGDEPGNLARDIRQELGIHMVLVHTAAGAAACCQQEVWREQSFTVENPAVLTGSGDNFNAGFCLGLLLELPVAECLLLAVATAAYYISCGVSPGREELCRYLEEKGEN